ncbi:MAG: YciI family protein [Devosia sp.]
MTKFLLVYHGGNAPSSKEEGEKVMAAWGQWIGGLGKALVDVGNPTGAAKTVAPGGKVSNGGGSNATTGYSILEAASLDAAVAAVKGCPQLAAGGTIEVAEITPVM